MVANPCCCMRLQSGVMILAVIDIILNSLNLLSICFAIAAFSALKDDNDDITFHNNITDTELNVGIGVLAVLLIFGILSLLLSIRLYTGAKNRDLRNCKIWLVISSIILTINIILLIVNSTTGETDTLNIVSTIIGMLYRLYMLYVVYVFIQEIRSQSTLMGFQARFEEGVGYTMQAFPNPNGGIVYSTPQQAYPQQPYPQQNFPQQPYPQQPYPQQLGVGPQVHSNSMLNRNNVVYNNSDYL